MNAQLIIDAVTHWAKQQPEIHAVALVGSYAYGAERVDSDIDFIILANNPNSFRNDTKWHRSIRWADGGAYPERWQDEEYGAVLSRRLWLEDGGREIEISFGLPSWAKTNPIDPGTRQVVSRGFVILHDPHKLLSRLSGTLANDTSP